MRVAAARSRSIAVGTSVCPSASSERRSTRPSVALDTPVDAERVTQERVLAVQAALDQIALEAIPKAQRALGIFRIEAGDLVDAAPVVARELPLPLGFARVERTRDFDRDVRSAAFPRLPSGERAGDCAHAHDQVRRQALARIGRIPIQDLVRTDRAALAHEIAH